MLATPAEAADYAFQMTGNIAEFYSADRNFNPVPNFPNVFNLGDSFSVRVIFSDDAQPTNLYDNDPTLNLYYPRFKSFELSAGSYSIASSSFGGILQLWDDYVSSYRPVDHFGLSGGGFFDRDRSPVDFPSSGQTFVSFHYSLFDFTAAARNSDLISELPPLNTYGAVGGGHLGFVDSNYNVTTMRLSNISASIAAVPEPTTWAMMIIGFGAIGAALRRRKVAPLAFI